MREHGHFDNLLGGHSVELLQEFHQLPPSCGTGTSIICTYGKMSTMCTAVCRWTPACVPCGSNNKSGRSPPGSSRRSKSSGWGGGTVVGNAAAPWPWLSSGPMGRYGLSLLPGPWRRSSVHTSSKHGGVGLFAAAAPMRA